MSCSRVELIETARAMLARELVTGSLGNVSCRQGDRITITPGSLAYAAMHPEDLVVLSLTGQILAGGRAPSSEFRLHLAIYARLPDARAIVHTHSPAATQAAAGASELSAPDSELLSVPIPVAAYRPPGSQELADEAAEALSRSGSCAVLLERHGVVGFGADLVNALSVCIEVERIAASIDVSRS